MRQEYEMTEGDLKTLLDACKPVPYMIIGGVPPLSPQQNANSVWKALAARMGFQWDTVEPIQGKSERFFTAETVPR